MANMRRLALTQLAAIARIRWQMSLNRLRTGRAKLEVFSKVVTVAALIVAGLGPAIGIGFAAYQSNLAGNVRLLSGILWLVLLAWQFLPTLVVAFTEAWDTAVLRRYPLSPTTYSIVWLISGAVDPGSLVAGLWLLAIFIGVSLASTMLAPWIFVVLLSFAGFNLLLSRLVLAWLSHWLEKRRTREIIGVLFMLLAIGNQLIAQIAERHLPRYLHSNAAGHLGVLFGLLPPGLTAKAIVHASSAYVAASAFALLLGYLLILGSLVAVRVRAEYLGENQGEAEVRGTNVTASTGRQAGIELLGVPHAISAVFDKEVRTLFRSPQLIASMLFVPPLVVILFGRFGVSATLAKSADLCFAFGLANSVVALTRLIYNSFGMERTGVQFYYLAPVRFRQFILGKNLAYAAILLLQTLLVFMAVALLFGLPSAAGATLALFALLFAVTVNISLGNVLSLIAPKKEEFSLTRQRGSAASGLVALGVQFAVLAIVVPLFLFVRRGQLVWLGPLCFVLLAVLGLVLYIVVLSRIDKLAAKRQEVIISELCRSF